MVDLDLRGSVPSIAVDNKGISGMRAKRFAVADFQNWTVIALGSAFPRMGSTKGSVAKV